MTGRQATISPAQRENCYLEVIKMTRGLTIKHSKQLNILNCCLKKNEATSTGQKIGVLVWSPHFTAGIQMC